MFTLSGVVNSPLLPLLDKGILSLRRGCYYHTVCPAIDVNHIFSHNWVLLWLGLASLSSQSVFTAPFRLY